MKKASKQVSPEDEDDLRPEYDFDYSKARPNRFLQGLGPGSIMVLLEPDVAKVFRTSEAVNEALRTLIASKGEGAGSPSSEKSKAS